MLSLLRAHEPLLTFVPSLPVRGIRDVCEAFSFMIDPETLKPFFMPGWRKSVRSTFETLLHFQNAFPG